MIHHVLRLYARLGIWFCFRKVYIEGRARVPGGRHVIYGMNHPTAFLEPIILGTHVGESCWYMLRGDKFVSPAVRWFLHAIHNLPIYKGGDASARDALRGNIETMDFATDRILDGEPTIILSEGVCRHERRLRPIQRGTARMLFQAYGKDRSKDVAIVPTAVNYTESNGFRSSVTITFAEAIRAADYAEAFGTDPRGTVDAVTDELYRRLRQHVIHVENPSRDALADKLLPLVKHRRPDPGLWPRSDRSPYLREQYRAIEALNAMDDFEAGRLERDLDGYLASLAQHGLSDSGVALPEYASMGKAALLWSLGTVALAGWIINFPPAAFTQRRTERMVRNPQFYSSVRFGLGLAVNLVYWLVWTAILAVFVGWFALLVPPVFGALGYFHLVHRDAFTLWQQSAKLRSVTPEVAAGLRGEVRDILARVGFFDEQGLAVDPELA